MTYEYQCTSEICGAVSEVIQPGSHERKEAIDCKYCGERAEFKISAPAVLTQNMSNKPFDVAVGKDAETRWNAIHERQSKRDKVRREANQVGLTATGFSEFKPISDSQRQARSKGMAAVERDGFKPEPGSSI